MVVNEYLMKIIEISKDMEQLGLFCEAKVSKTEFRLLREVIMEREKGNQIISSELARRLGITRSAVSQLVKKMEERNIVKRVDSPTDRKIAYVQLSENAYSAFEEYCQAANAVMEKIVAKMGEEKLKTLVTIYDEFADVFRQVAKDGNV